MAELVSLRDVYELLREVQAMVDDILAGRSDADGLDVADALDQRPAAAADIVMQAIGGQR